ncbi:ribosome biogenesis GTPase / thiamine phosphate phosphatase [Anaerolineales bacterium]|nr:ribosome biogenesis GTPase / thiamine phosphate phosphatase [Anaerolineales bacterium]
MNTTDENDQGVVFRKSLGHYTVHTNGREIDCALSSRLHKQSHQHTADPIAVGDQVRFLDTGQGSGIITEILTRRSSFSRPLPGQRVVEQVIAANVDQILPVFAAASPTPKWGLLDRYLVAAEAAGLPSQIIVTKMDLADNDSLESDLEIYRRIGYPIHLVCASTGEGLDDLNHTLSGRTSVLVGKSGVGKTSLMNAIQPELGLRIKAVSEGEVGKGRHTTSHLQMFELDFGGRLVDTPGIREFGLWNIHREELASHFREMAPYVGGCKFGLSCQHDHEPGCAIRKAVMDGQINPYRYQSYMRLQEEL